ncbi:hypothetical protein [Nocardia crassostreae]|uniref:hypothetical protein n=1 Tax=Nocardia crassostreae TaxID=53428 RepID=UPI0008318F30|nr:hypothetical protein [Nocardia crassostreae]
MTDSLTMAAIDTVSQTVNSYAAAAAGMPLPQMTWMWDCCSRFATASGEAEFRGTVHPDLPDAEASAQLLQWARALDMVESITDREAADGRRSFTGTIGAARIRLTAVVETLSPATETQPLLIVG